MTMSNAVLREDTLPWYRQGWPWALIALPASAVIGGIVTIIVAINSPNALVVDDYYKEGLAINQEKDRVRHAGDLQLTALVRGNDNGSIAVTLDARQPVNDKSLVLEIIHITRADFDRTLILQRNADGSYGAPLAPLQSGTWYLKLHNADNDWEVRARTHIDGTFQAHLTTDKD